MISSRLFASLLIAVVLAGGHTGCASAKKTTASEMTVARRPMMPEPQGSGRGLRNGDVNVPKVPPAGARVVYNSVPMSQPFVAITFDDGPHPTNTPRLLDMLKQRNIKATFYVVGKCVQEYPHIVRRILAEGHEIGNHTWSHNALSGMTAEGVRSELTRTHEAVVAASGYQMRTMRPPYGATNLRVKQQCFAEFGYPTILWSVDPYDWKKPGASVVQQRIVSATQPGGIILVHDIHKPTIDAMPGTFDALLSKGYRFVTVSQLMHLGASGPEPMVGAVAAPAPAPMASPPPLPPAGMGAMPVSLPPTGPVGYPYGQPAPMGGIPSEGAILR